MMNKQSKEKKSLYQHHCGTETTDINLGEIFVLIKAQKKFVFIVTFIIFLIATFYTLYTPTLYEATALIQIETNKPSMDSELKDMSSALGFGAGGSTSDSVAVETALISSSFILQPTIESLGLNTKIAPHYFPIFGKLLASKHNKEGSLAKPFLWMSSYAWGGERIKIKQFTVPDNLLNKKLILKITSQTSYELYSENRQLLLEGKVDKLAKTKSSDNNEEIQILITDIIANPNCEFFITPKSIDKISQQLLDNLTISDLGYVSNATKNTGRKGGETGVLSIDLKGEDTKQLPLILNTIVSLSVQKNIGKKTEDVQKTLELLTTQSVDLKNDLDKSETALSSYKAKQGALSRTEASTVLLNQMVDIEKSIAEAKLKKAELLQDFTLQHPYVLTINKQIQGLQDELSILESKVQILPKTEQQLLGLERDVKTKDELYILLLGKIQQLQITKAGITSDIRILTPASIATETTAKAPLILFGSIMFGIILAISIILARRLLVQNMDDPYYIEEYLDIPLYAVIPYSKNQQQLIKEFKYDIHKTKSFILAELYSKDLVIESLKGLSNVLLRSLQKAQNNIITILGTRHNIGKSFISLNLAHVLADDGKKVLLIDANLHQGKIHTYLAQFSHPGLTEILARKTTFTQTKKSLDSKKFTNNGNIDFIPCGKHHNNPTELLIDNNIENLIANIAHKYDVVIINTSPVMAGSDATIIAKNSGINLLLVGSRKENMTDLEFVIKRLKKHNIDFQGLIFNHNKPTILGHGHSTDYYVATPQE